MTTQPQAVPEWVDELADALGEELSPMAGNTFGSETMGKIKRLILSHTPKFEEQAIKVGFTAKDGDISFTEIGATPTVPHWVMDAAEEICRESKGMLSCIDVERIVLAHAPKPTPDGYYGASTGDLQGEDMRDKALPAPADSNEKAPPSGTRQAWEWCMKNAAESTPSPGAMRAAEKIDNDLCVLLCDKDVEDAARIIDAETGAAEAWALLREAQHHISAHAKIRDRIDAALARHEGDKA